MKTGDVQLQNHANQLERACWTLVGLSMLTQLSSTVLFPSYNIALGFWGLYAAFSKQGRATFGLIAFCLFAIVVDIIFCSLAGSQQTSTNTFCLTMFIFCLFIKVVVVYIAAHYFASLGGASSMDSSQINNSSIYEPLSTSAESGAAAMYYPTQSNPMIGMENSFVAESTQKKGTLFESV
jgi:hypothetical protein